MASESRNSDFIQSLARGLEVLEYVAKNGGRATVGDISDALEISRPTVRRLLLTLESLQYLGREGREFLLRPRFLRLSLGYRNRLDLSELVAGELDSLAADLGEAVSMSVRDRGEIVYVARAKIDKIMTIRLDVGARLPLWQTSMGRVLIAPLKREEIRELFEESEAPVARTQYSKVAFDDLWGAVQVVIEQGFCVVDQELEIGLRSVAVPIRLGSRTVASVNAATANVAESVPETIARVLPGLQARARQISSLLEDFPELLGITDQKA